MQIERDEEYKRIFSDYLARLDFKDPYNFSFDLDAFRVEQPLVTQDIIKSPSKYYSIIRNVLDTRLHEEKKKYEAKIDHFYITFEGNLGSNFVTPRGLTSRMANELVGIQGIVTKMDLMKSYLQKSVHWCEKTKNIQVKEYPDSFAPEKQFETKKTKFIRNYDDNNNPLDFEYGLSSFRNIQQIVVQELPEMAPPGLLPQSVTAILQGDLVNTVKPGDRIEIVGIYKLVAGSMSKQKGIFKPYFLCLSIRHLNMSLSTTKMTSKMPCPQNQLFSLFGRSIAPSIYGHEHLKKAVLLMLLGGVQKVLQNGTHLRGDINVLMVGDPGTAKSQILRWVLSTVDLGICTTGSGASGVGLTAAIVTQRQTGEKTLEAGAMVLADRGVVCIDEFDKMSEIDRVAVHEVMEQQTVTIAKAGIHCSLNARCSVIAAANPIYGQYQKDKPPTKNIGMADSLLSRFDLIFIIFDEKDADKDKSIAERVCRNHRLAPPVNQWSNQFHEDDHYIIQPAQNNNTRTEEITFDRSQVFRSETRTEVLAQSFLKKYINYCKANVHPVLQDDSITLLSSLWSVLRQRDFTSRETSQTKVLPITIRSYETMIRLSTAHAKLRQSSVVELADCVQAFRLMAFCLEGSESALDQELIQVLKQNNLEAEIPKAPEEVSRAGTKNEKKKKEEVEDVTKRLQKIQIGKEQKQVEKVLKRSNPLTTHTLYGLLAKYKDKVNSETFLVADILTELKSKNYNVDNIQDLLESLSGMGKIHYGHGRIDL